VALSRKSVHFVVSYKRLDRGVFRIPELQLPGSTQVEIDEAKLDALLDGIEVVAKPKRDKKRLLH